MKFNFSENLKKLRLSKKFTQEQVAEFLNCSVQSVSRWECGNTFPDIMMLPLIARLYSTTVDSLLGTDFERSKEELENYYKKRQKYLHNGQCEKVYELSKEMYEKYPNDKDVQLYIAEDTYAYSYLDSKQGKNQWLNETIKLCMRHLDVTDDIKAKCRYITYISRSYEELGEHKKAIEWVNKLPEEFMSVGHNKNYILEGAELIQNEMNVIDSTFNNLINYMMLLADIEYRNEKTPYDFWQRIDILKKIIKMIELIYEDGDYGFVNVNLADLYRIIGACYANCKMADETLKYLECSVNYSIKFCEYIAQNKPYKHTSLLFLNYCEDPMLATKNYTGSHLNLTYDKLTQERYDFLRDDDRFKNLILKIKEKI